MSTAALLLEDFDYEMANTRATRARVPEGKESWVPHERSMPLGKLAMHCGTMPLFGTYIMLDDGMDMANSHRPHVPLDFTTREHCLKTFDESAAHCRAALAAATDEQLAAPWKFSFGEHVISNHSRSLTYRLMCFNHMIHHVAQLGVYLRLNEIPVPALYGPSADEQWKPK